MKTVLLCLLAAVLSGCSGDFEWADLWFTPDRQGDRLMRQGRFAEAAAAYRDPLRKGVALFRNGDFEAAEGAFSAMDTAEAHFNRGNALVLQGRYADAVAAYDRSLDLSPEWKPAETNREIARIRAERLQKEGGDMTGGKLAADEVVFEPGKDDGDGPETTVEAQVDEGMSDAQLRELWLRRVQTRPADFLRAKFAYQAAQAGNPPGARPE
jgi:Ca-activated chloride channel family protein